MSLYEQWQTLAYAERNEQEYEDFWKDYLLKEQNIYENILEHKMSEVKGTLNELAKEYEVDDVTFTGFLDGINTSLKQELDLDSIDKDSNLEFIVDFEKLYFNMHKAKADWLYNLPHWNEILTEKKRKEIKKEYNRSTMIINDKKIGRNEPCPCGSGKKYKKCCGK